jgi:hypothetical protein
MLYSRIGIKNLSLNPAPTDQGPNHVYQTRFLFDKKCILLIFSTLYQLADRNKPLIYTSPLLVYFVFKAFKLAVTLMCQVKTITKFKNI